eukprot:01662.XXX_6676_6985_1 [CDS] Oithona nana genome sequencing.
MTNMMGRIIIVKRGATFSTWKITEPSLSSWGFLGGEEMVVVLVLTVSHLV